jgi:glycosyltransferase involved in cell wall biosynthesis
MADVSIIMPTFNRADTLPRAVESVRAQTFTDWELVIVDDGSTDGTAALLAGLKDPRIKVMRQENQGCYVARNVGMRAGSGRYVTFLDSDDEWLPWFLELTVGFLRASPEDHVVMTEFLEKSGTEEPLLHDHHEISVKYPRIAAQVDSRLMDLPPGEKDDYLRVYKSKEPLGAWGRDAAARAGYPGAMLYRGSIFEHLRFGHLGWLPTLVITRQALAAVGDFLPNYRTAADYRFLGLLYRNYRTNLIALPAAIKHSDGVSGGALAEGHLATGPNEYRYAIHRLPLYDEFFQQGRETDEELRRIRGYYLAYAGRVAAEHGRRKEAIQHLGDAARANPRMRSARLLQMLVRLMPNSEATKRLFQVYQRAEWTMRGLSSGRITPADLVRKAGSRILERS